MLIQHFLVTVQRLPMYLRVTPQIATSIEKCVRRHFGSSALFFVALQGLPAAPQNPATFRGSIALADAVRATGFGQRPSGSDANKQLRAWIESQLKPLGGQFTEDAFTGHTPGGPVPMVNVLLRFPGTSAKRWRSPVTTIRNGSP